MWYLLAALIVGIIIGLNIPWTIPAILARYLAVSLLAGVDTSLGGLRASLEGDFDIAIFVTGFVYLGDVLGIELYLAAVVALGVRIFNNLGRIRRHLLKEWMGETAQPRPKAEVNRERM
jgi:small basic protein